MGNGAGFFGGKKLPPARRDPIQSASEAVKSEEAKTVVSNVIKSHPPGLPNRWEKILSDVNIDVAPTEKCPDPLRLQLDVDNLLQLLRFMYDEVKFISSDGLALMREYIPKLYDKHSYDRGKRVSQLEREDKGIFEDYFAYGELNIEIFATIYIKIVSVYGAQDNGIFYDLGCGVGQLVYAAVLIGKFKKACGVECIFTLLERGEKRMTRWEKMTADLAVTIKNANIQWIDDNVFENDFWVEASFILLHWTAFANIEIQKLSELFEGCSEGCQVVTFTKPIQGTSFKLLLADKCETSWGLAEFFLQEKVTPAKKRLR